MMNFIIGIFIGYVLAKVKKEDKYRLYKGTYTYSIEIKHWWLPIYIDMGIFGNMRQFTEQETAEEELRRLQGENK